MLESTVSFSHYVYLLQGIHNRTFCLHTQTNFRFHRQKVSFPQLAWGWFSRGLTCFARSNIHIKNYSAIARRKNIPFYPARTDIDFSYFQLARRSFRFPSQLTSQWFFFFQLAQILPEERVFFFERLRRVLLFFENVRMRTPTHRVPLILLCTLLELM